MSRTPHRAASSPACLSARAPSRRSRRALSTPRPSTATSSHSPMGSAGDGWRSWRVREGTGRTPMTFSRLPMASAGQSGLSDTAIRKRAKAKGWTRNLSAAGLDGPSRAHAREGREPPGRTGIAASLLVWEGMSAPPPGTTSLPAVGLPVLFMRVSSVHGVHRCAARFAVRRAWSPSPTGSQIGSLGAAVAAHGARTTRAAVLMPLQGIGPRRARCPARR